MKRIEITYRSNANELEKLNAKLERAKKAYDKKLIAAQKAGVADWTNEQRREWLDSVPTTKDGWIINKADIKKNGAWLDLYGAEREVEDIEERIERAEARFEKVEKQLDTYREELEKIADLQKKEELMKAEFEQEKKEWAKDGIKLEGRYYGTTPKGKKFDIYGNCGWTERSRHCFTLRIDNDTIFTSGEFWRAYLVVKNR